MKCAFVVVVKIIDSDSDAFKQKSLMSCNV